MKSRFIYLGLILLAGFLLRLPYLNFPSIGYHNMKENEYIGMATEMLRTGDFLNRRVYFYNGLEKGPGFMDLYPQLPLVSYQIILAWKLFGNNLWGPRLIQILFMLGAIVIIYHITKRLMQDARCALLSSALLAIMPLGVFFARNLQPESPAFFFMLLASFFYLRFISTFKFSELFYAGLSVSVTFAYKYSFLISLFPLAFIFPHKDFISYLRKNNISVNRFLSIAFFSLLPALILFLFFILRNEWIFPSNAGRIRLLEIFTAGYWHQYGLLIIKYYFYQENFTFWYAILGCAGVFFALANKKELVSRYILGQVAAAVIYAMVFSDYINQHAYYQMPFLGVMCISSVLAIRQITQVLKSIFKKELFAGFCTVLIMLSFPEIKSALTAAWQTVFYGQEIAGDFIRKNTQSNERFFHLTHPSGQGHAVSTYAQRRCGWTWDLEEFKRAENDFNIKLLCVYPAGILETLYNNKDLYSYIRDNYRVIQIGDFLEKGQFYFSYLILQRPGKLDIPGFIRAYKDKAEAVKVYEVFGKKTPFFLIKAE